MRLLATRILLWQLFLSIFIAYVEWILQNTWDHDIYQLFSAGCSRSSALQRRWYVYLLNIRSYSGTSVCGKTHFWTNRKKLKFNGNKWFFESQAQLEPEAFLCWAIMTINLKGMILQRGNYIDSPSFKLDVCHDFHWNCLYFCAAVYCVYRVLVYFRVPLASCSYDGIHAFFVDL